MDQNIVSLVGRLGDDPKFYPDPDESKQRVWLRLAVNRGGRKDANGNDLTDWIPIIVFGKKAVAVNNNCHKGKEICVTGELHERSMPYTLANGQELVHPETGKVLYRNSFEIMASRISFGRPSEKYLAAHPELRNRLQQGQAATAPAPAPGVAYAPAPAPAPMVPPSIPAVDPTALQAIIAQAVQAQLAAEHASQATANPLAGMAG